MPRCYFLAISEASSLDAGSNNWSLFNLVEKVTLPLGEGLDRVVPVPLQAHAYWAFPPDELGRDFEFRLVYEKEGEAVGRSDGFPLKSLVPRHRYRILGVPLITVPASYELRVEYRAKDAQEWTRGDAFWPIEVVAREEAQTQAFG